MSYEQAVADVQQACQAIGQRRSQLIALKGQYAAQIMDGSIIGINNLD